MKLNVSADATDHTLAEINITPMVDVMLVLLIIFMITAPLLQMGVAVDLPETEAQTVEATPEDVILTIDQNGQIFFQNDAKLTFGVESLPEKLAAIYENKQRKSILLHADKNLRYGYIVQIMAACQQAGIESIGMVSEPEEKARVR